MAARNIRLLAWLGFLTEFKLYAPVAVIYFQTVTGSFTGAMAVIAAGVISSTIFEVPTGLLSDRIGRKYTLILSAVFFVFYVLLMALAESGALLFCAAMVAGFSDALASGNNNALLYESARQAGRKDDFSTIMGRNNALAQAALGVSAIAGGIMLAFGASLNDLVWISLMPQIMRVALGFFIVAPPPEETLQANIFHDLREALRLFRENPRLRLLTLASAIQFGVGEAAHRFGPAFIQTLWPLWAINTFNSLRNLFGAAGFWLAGRVIKKFGELPVLLTGSALMALSGIAAVLMNNIFSPLLIYLNSLLHGPNAVAREHLMQKQFSDRQRATMGSLSEFCASLFTAAAALLLGVIADASTPGIAFLTAMILRLPVLWLYARLFRD